MQTKKVIIVVLDLIFVLAGVTLILLGAEVHISLSFMRTIMQGVFWMTRVDRYVAYFVFTFAGQAYLLCSRQCRGKLVRTVTFILSIAVFAVSIMLLVHQANVFSSLKSSDMPTYPCSPLNATSGQFCVWQNGLQPAGTDAIKRFLPNVDVLYTTDAKIKAPNELILIL